jgi:hypothetical protein
VRTLDAVESAELVADLAPADPAAEEAELGLDVVQLATPTAVVLLGVPRNQLLALAEVAKGSTS